VDAARQKGPSALEVEIDHVWLDVDDSFVERGREDEIDRDDVQKSDRKDKPNRGADESRSPTSPRAPWAMGLLFFVYYTHQTVA
jgi:hypothetical protein